jgi:hypothetical protein
MRPIILCRSATHLSAIADNAIQQPGRRREARPKMWRKIMRTKLLAAVAVLGLGVAPAFAADNASGYVFSDFWGNEAAQQSPAGKAPVQANDPTIGIYVTQSRHGTWLFQPNPNQGNG